MSMGAPLLNEVITIGKDAIKGHLVHLFNRILHTGKNPALWSFGLIVPIHKKDDRSKVENYRGITLLSAIGKLFTSILNNRLYDYMVQKGILKAEQGGFGKMHGNVDSIFTLKTLIDKYVRSKPQRHRNLLFSCFVDFRKAFYCIPILGDPGADSGGEGKSKRAEKYGTKKRNERREEPLGTMSYQTSSKRSPPF